MASMRELAMDLLSRAGSGPVLQPTNVYGQDPDLPIGYGEGEISPLDAAAMSTMLVPGVGDVTGLAADVDMYMRDPESRNIPNYLLTAAGALPFLPAASQVRKGIKAYHGSPHSFDRFSTEQIGTGEGAQAYGQGLYFTESEDVAKGYKKQLSARNSFAQAERDFIKSMEDSGLDLSDEGVNSDSLYQFSRQYVNNDGDLSETLKDARRTARLLESDGQDASEMRAVIKAIEKSERLGFKPPSVDKGSMYEVNIDVEPDELIDWDTPISQQSKKVQDAVYANRDAVDQRIVDDYFGGDRNNIINEDMTGQQYMANMDKVNAGMIDGTEYELAERGVKGVRYADAFTRHKTPDKRSMNYVIFDDRLITIAKKYGIAIPAAAAMLARMTGEDTSQSYQEET
jgi:hypothetical protein